MNIVGFDLALPKFELPVVALKAIKAIAYSTRALGQFYQVIS
jgi:hypothetical protein